MPIVALRSLCGMWLSIIFAICLSTLYLPVLTISCFYRITSMFYIFVASSENDFVYRDDFFIFYLFTCAFVLILPAWPRSNLFIIYLYHHQDNLYKEFSKLRSNCLPYSPVLFTVCYRHASWETHWQTFSRRDILWGRTSLFCLADEVFCKDKDPNNL